MAVLPIVTAPDPRLKKKSEPVAAVDDKIRLLMDDMLETMYHANGLGLAAVQIGIHKRVIVMDIEQRENEDKKGVPLYFVNPEIITCSEDESAYTEGCLSFPDAFSEVIRPASVKVRYLDYHGKEQEIIAEGLLATCIQHEIDHINGVVFVDHISSIKRDMIMRKMRKVKRTENA